jgi:CubicO group peptidase (beta-lactamase class C family)
MDLIDRLGQALRPLVAAGRRPGLVHGVVRADGPPLVEAVGSADVSAGAPMRPDSLFRLYSQTRIITTVAVLTLVERGLLRLAEPVSRFVPEFAATEVLVTRVDGTVTTEAQATPMTVAHLLTYTAGLGYAHDYPPELGLRHQDVLGTHLDVATGMRRLAEFPLLDQPGRRWRYGFSGDLLGLVAERAAGESLPDLLRHNVFEPVNMPDTAFWAPPAQHHRLTRIHRATPAGGWADVSDEVLQLGTWTNDGPLKSGGGGLISTAPDFLRFCRMLLGEGTIDGVRVLRPESVAAILSRQTTEDQGLVDDLREPSAATRGYAWGYGVGIRAAGVPHGVPGSPGDAAWSGLADTHFVIDRSRGLAAVALAQYFGPDADALPIALRAALRPD